MEGKIQKAHREWASRPDDERFVGLLPMLEQMKAWKAESRGLVLSTRAVQATPEGDEDHKGLVLRVNPGSRRGLDEFRTVPGSVDIVAAPTHWSFGQLAQRAGAPAGYLRTLPSEMAADCINYGLMVREVEEVGLLVRANGDLTAAAVTGPHYGRIWNLDVVDALVKRFGDGLTGQWRVPGEFGKRVEITKRNTTLYASDRDLFVFLADEDHRIEVPNRRNGQPGTLSRGAYIWNSEVGAATFGIGLFLYDYACCNRIIHGGQDYKEITIRHTSGGPDRFFEEAAPLLKEYAESSAAPVQALLQAAQAKKIGTKEKVAEFLAARFTKSQASQIAKVHEEEEGRPIRTLWDAAVGATAYARGIT